MRHIASVVLVTLVAAGWATCAAAAPAGVMACCAKVQHECPKMEQVKMCCPEGTQSKPDTAAAGVAPIASVSVQSHAAFLSRSVVSSIFEIPFHPCEPVTEITPPSRHST